MLIFCDGYDHYASAQFVSGQKWDAVGGGGQTVGSTYARSGGQGAKLSWGFVTKNVTALPTYIVGTAFQFTATDSSGSNSGGVSNIINFLDGGTSQIQIGIDPTGHLFAKRGSTLLGTSTTTVAINSYRYLEAKVTVNSTTGSVVVRLDGTVVINLTGVNTQASGTAQITVINIGCTVQFAIVYLDDTYICDTTTPNSAGNNNADFLGDVKVNALLPSAVGGFTQWTRAGTNTGQDYSQINELTPPDEDTTYVTDATIGDRDSFKFTPFTLVGSIFGAVLWTRARKDDAGTRTLASVARSSAVDIVGSNYNLAATYQYYGTVFEIDPATTALWTTLGLNAAEFGFKTIA
jgi:hypothetical protein